MPSFQIGANHLVRLAQLHLAIDESPGPLCRISCQIRGTRVRFIATNGRWLAILAIDITPAAEADIDLLLDAGQLTSACKTISKIKSRIFPPVDFTIDLDRKEARFSNAHAAAVVKIHDGTFPALDHVISRVSGHRWVPSVSTLDLRLVTAAAKIIGRPNPLFVSAVPPASHAPRLWGSDAPDQDRSVALDDVRHLARQPAMWADAELLVLVMGITRSGDEHQLDLVPFIAAPATLHSSAAA